MGATILEARATPMKTQQDRRKIREALAVLAAAHANAVAKIQRAIE